MTASSARWVWLAAVGLGTGVAVEIAWPPSQPDAPTNPVPVPSLAEVQPPGTEPLAAWTMGALARPLFMPGRRPDPAGGTLAAADVAPGLPRLTGILLSASGRRAIFAAPPGGTRPTVLGEGGAVGAWRIEAIHAGDVLIAGPQGRRTVRVAFSEGPPVLAGMQLPQPLQPDTRTSAFSPTVGTTAPIQQLSPAVRTLQ